MHDPGRMLRMLLDRITSCFASTMLSTREQGSNELAFRRQEQQRSRRQLKRTGMRVSGCSSSSTGRSPLLGPRQLQRLSRPQPVRRDRQASAVSDAARRSRCRLLASLHSPRSQMRISQDRHAGLCLSAIDSTLAGGRRHCRTSAHLRSATPRLQTALRPFVPRRRRRSPQHYVQEVAGKLLRRLLTCARSGARRERGYARQTCMSPTETPHPTAVRFHVCWHRMRSYHA